MNAASAATQDDELVILVDDDGAPIGVAAKQAVHHAATPLHLAFSCYVFDRTGEQLLITRRASSKPTWPGVWTNSCCGHPLPGEQLADAVRRRLDKELGLVCEDLELVLPRFRYRAEMANGMCENELCPVLRAVAEGRPTLDEEEADDCRWVAWAAFADEVLAAQRPVSPWCAAQVRQLVRLGSEPLAWRAAAAVELPIAARDASAIPAMATPLRTMA